MNIAVSIIPGLEFARKYELTRKEIEIFLALNNQELTANKLAELFGQPRSTVINTVTRLRYKKLLTWRRQMVDDKSFVFYKIADLNAVEKLEIAEEQAKSAPVVNQ